MARRLETLAGVKAAGQRYDTEALWGAMTSAKEQEVRWAAEDELGRIARERQEAAAHYAERLERTGTVWRRA